MKAIIGNPSKIVNAWEIGSHEEEWVKEAFAKKIFEWETRGTGRYLVYYRVYIGETRGRIGDYIVYDGDSYILLSKNKFLKNYRMVD